MFTKLVVTLSYYGLWGVCLHVVKIHLFHSVSLMKSYLDVTKAPTTVIHVAFRSAQSKKISIVISERLGWSSAGFPAKGLC